MFLSNFCEINRLNNFCLDNKGMDFRPNITPMEVIKKGTFARTYFRNIYSGCMFLSCHVRVILSCHVLVPDMIRTYNQMHRTDKYSQLSSIIWPVWLNG